jgi:Concanavalin A-like lectin/glucanases superfamily
MADIWELICHHTYAGIPGVIVDTSPPAASYGIARNLSDANFLADGVAPGSGAVSVSPFGSVYVPATASSWRVVEGIRGQVLFRYQPSSVAQLIDGDTFQFYIRANSLTAHFSSYPVQYAEINSALDAVGSPPYQLPVGQWVTLGFMHDGFGTIELSANGQVIARRTGVFAPIDAPGPAGINIGNDRSLDSPLNGQIDDVQIWRLNPRRFDQDFYGRPMDGATAECWKCFREEIDAALKRHPDCAQLVAKELAQVIANFLHQVLAKGPETTAHLLKSARAYAQHWHKGQIDTAAMIKVFGDLIAWLELVGLAPQSDAQLAAFINSECFKTIAAEIKPPDCDPQFVKLLQSIAASLGGGSHS